MLQRERSTPANLFGSPASFNFLVTRRRAAMRPPRRYLVRSSGFAFLSFASADESARALSIGPRREPGAPAAESGSVEDAQQILDAWRSEHNNERPHSSLRDLSPAQFRAREDFTPDRTARLS